MQVKKICLALIIIMISGSCQNRGTVTKSEMSVDEARDLALQMQNVSLEPPPRKINDILSILNESGSDNPGSVKGREYLDKIRQSANRQTPPEGLGPTDLYLFYKNRGNARYELTRFNQCRGDFRKAIAYGDEVSIHDPAVYRNLAELEMFAGRYESALELAQTAVKSLKVTIHYGKYASSSLYRYSGIGQNKIISGSWRYGPYMALQSRVYHRMGNFRMAKKTIRSANEAYASLSQRTRRALSADPTTEEIGNQNDILAAEAEMLEAQGRYAEASPLRSMILNYRYHRRRMQPLKAVNAQLNLVHCLMHTGRLMEAEKQVRSATMDAIGIHGKNSVITAKAAQTFGELMLFKGDLKSADLLSSTQRKILASLSLKPDEDMVVQSHLLRASILNAQYQFQTAMSDFDLALEGMAHNLYLYNRYAVRNHDLILCLINNGRIAEAENLIRQTRELDGTLDIEDIYELVEIQALEAMVLAARQKRAEALIRWRKSISTISSILQDPASDYKKRRRADFLVQAYIDMLLKGWRPGEAARIDFDIADEVFKLAAARPTRVNKALAQSSARAASLTDPELAELVRQEQDTGKRIESLKGTYYNAMVASGGETSSELANLERAIQSLSAARQTLFAQIEAEFPRYANYINPKATGMAKIQQALLPSEAFIAIWTLKDKTCVWAIPSKDNPVFTTVEIGRQAVSEKVQVLRTALKHNAGWLSEIPDYDVTIAHELFQDLLAPVKAGWEKASDIIAVVRGPLDQIPLAILTTEPSGPVFDRNLRFDSYRQTPWLIRKVSMTRLPSAASLLTLRQLPVAGPNRDPFAGFGDPIFNQNQLMAAEAAAPHLPDKADKTVEIAVRGIRVSDLGDLDDGNMISASLESLQRLPDTAGEIENIAAVLGVADHQAIFLRRQASETNVKTRNLSDKRIVAFATHALLPGDLDGLDQPALAFSSPEVTGLDEDGLLTAGEILTLKLDADLVILSACDTGAGEGGGSEAISGLGRAFFYSGARALLVTMWPVETTSARKLTTGMFRFQKNNPDLSRARALRASLLDLMDNGKLENPIDHEPVASLAHPSFWAPFIVVGDGSRY